MALDVSFFGMKIDTVKEGLALGREANHQVFEECFEGVVMPQFYILQ